MQKWMAACPASSRDPALAVLNAGTYAFDATPRELRLNLLRSPVYTYLPLRADDAPVPSEFHPRVDQGERVFRFRVLLGPAGRLLATVDREAQTFNEEPFLLSYFPPGSGAKMVKPLVEVADDSILVTAVKRAEHGRDLVIRLFEPSGRQRTAALCILGRFRRQVTLAPFEIKTLRVNPQTGRCVACALTE